MVPGGCDQSRGRRIAEDRPQAAVFLVDVLRIGLGGYQQDPPRLPGLNQPFRQRQTIHEPEHPRLKSMAPLLVRKFNRDWSKHAVVGSG